MTADSTHTSPRSRRALLAGPSAAWAYWRRRPSDALPQRTPLPATRSGWVGSTRRQAPPPRSRPRPVRPPSFSRQIWICRPSRASPPVLARSRALPGTAARASGCERQSRLCRRAGSRRLNGRDGRKSRRLRQGPVRLFGTVRAFVGLTPRPAWRPSSRSVSTMWSAPGHPRHQIPAGADSTMRAIVARDSTGPARLNCASGLLPAPSRSSPPSRRRPVTPAAHHPGGNGHAATERRPACNLTALTTSDYPAGVR